LYFSDQFKRNRQGVWPKTEEKRNPCRDLMR
jgi:hypothetical protein